MFEFRRLYCAHAKLHAPFPFDGLLWKETPLLATERLWSNLAGIQTVHSRLTSSQHILIVPETPDSLLICSQPSLLHTASICSFLGCHYSRVIRTSLSQSNLIGPPTFRRRERERNRPFTRPIFPVGRKMVWEVVGTRLVTNAGDSTEQNLDPTKISRCTYT